MTTPTSSPPPLSQRALLGLLRGYQILISPHLGQNCRFAPTCSSYAIDAIRAHGAGMGTYLGMRRLARCHPWCEGGIDEVPTHAPRLSFSFFSKQNPS